LRPPASTRSSALAQNPCYAGDRAKTIRKIQETPFFLLISISIFYGWSFFIVIDLRETRLIHPMATLT
jgi:hypothetical protein